MAHFYGVMQGSRGEATRCGTKSSGLTVTAASWSGAVTVSLWFNDKTGENEYTVRLREWHGSGESREIASGTLGNRKVDERMDQLQQVAA